MRTKFMLLALVVLSTTALLSCGVDRDAGRVFLAEREMYRADREYRDLTIRPQDVDEAAWRSLAERYEQVGARFGSTSDGKTTTSRHQLRILSARALFAAAQLHGGIGDSAAVDEIYRRMASSYGDLPEVAAEVALAQAGLAERKGDLEVAAGLYRSVVDLVEPDPTKPGARSAVLGLPLHVARLRSIAREGTADEKAYSEAEEYYRRMASQHPGEIVQIDADAYRAEIAADRGNWRSGVEILRRLETQLRAADKPERDPAATMLARCDLMTRAGADPESARAVLTALLDDFPKSKVAPRALIALAANANQRNRVDEALGHLDRIPAEYKEDEDAASQALLIRAKLLDDRDRWPEAQETLATLMAQHALSEAALTAPLVAVEHYLFAGDAQAKRDALHEAERHYRDFIDRYPPSRFSIMARERLVQVLVSQENSEAAVTEMVKLGEDLKGSERGAGWFASAAAMAYDKLNDPKRTIAILDRMSELYARADAGSWAANEARRLREAPAP